VLGAAAAVAPARFVRFSEARPILTELAGTLPPELNTLTPAQMATAWPGWIERHDREVRARLEQGDEDTIVNWMLFGTSFTSRPRAVLGAVESDAAAAPSVYGPGGQRRTARASIRASWTCDSTRCMA